MIDTNRAAFIELYQTLYKLGPTKATNKLVLTTFRSLGLSMNDADAKALLKSLRSDEEPSVFGDDPQARAPGALLGSRRALPILSTNAPVEEERAPGAPLAAPAEGSESTLASGASHANKGIIITTSSCHDSTLLSPPYGPPLVPGSNVVPFPDRGAANGGGGEPINRATPSPGGQFGQWFWAEGLECGAIEAIHRADGSLAFAYKFLKPCTDLVAVYGREECERRSRNLFARKSRELGERRLRMEATPALLREHWDWFETDQPPTRNGEHQRPEGAADYNKHVGVRAMTGA